MYRFVNVAIINITYPRMYKICFFCFEFNFDLLPCFLIPSTISVKNTIMFIRRKILTTVNIIDKLLLK